MPEPLKLNVAEPVALLEPLMVEAADARFLNSLIGCELMFLDATIKYRLVKYED